MDLAWPQLEYLFQDAEKDPRKLGKRQESRIFIFFLLFLSQFSALCLHVTFFISLKI
jgi:hypothetical protein